MFKWEKHDSKAPSKRSDFILCWVKDLLDENANQTTGHLKDDTGRCCLGVACDTAKLKWRVDKEAYGDYYDIQYGKNNQYLESQNLPGPLHKFLKCDDNGYFTGNVKISNKILVDVSLTDLNDEHGLSFREIAKVIQNNCEILFSDLSKKEIKYIQSFKIPTRKEMRETKKKAI